jgi:hypothetical protein
MSTPIKPAAQNVLASSPGLSVNGLVDAVSVQRVASPPAPPPELAEDLDKLIRGGVADDVSAHLETICSETNVDGTKTTIRWHRLVHHNTLNQPDVAKLVAKLLKLVMDFACSRDEIARAAKQFNETGSTEGFAALNTKARSLFTKKGKKTGEVGEILLYYLAERVLRYPQVLCKMPHKTNPEMHAHGADGIHGSVHPSTKHLRLHWGEAKLYQDITAAMDDCCESLAEMILQKPGGKKTSARDIELLRDFVDLKDPDLENVIKAYLDPDSKLSNQVEFCGLALVGFDLTDYETFYEHCAKAQSAQIAARITDWSGKLKTALKKHKLLGITIDAFCIPLRSVENVRKEFLKGLGVSHGT